MQFAQRCVWGGWKPHKYWVFPHYMWGYIAPFFPARLLCVVPSLYVRVYLRSATSFHLHTCSLIICEGISRLSESIKTKTAFPHYMWGYIGAAFEGYDGQPVPSLYVRVYRYVFACPVPVNSSLIICEGISYTSGKWFHYRLFPHYMWGYIAFRKFCRMV